MLLLLPVILFFLGLPNKGITKGWDVNLSAADNAALDEAQKGANKGSSVVPLSFLDLERAAMNPRVRNDLEGRLINVTGQYFNNSGDPYRFTLQRYKINCCAADAIPLNAIILINPPDQKTNKMDPEQYKNQWVSVTGRLHFIPRPNGEYLTAVFLMPTTDMPLPEIVKIVPADANPYAY
jgi:hypothetical protein